MIINDMTALFDGELKEKVYGYRFFPAHFFSLFLKNAWSLSVKYLSRLNQDFTKLEDIVILRVVARMYIS